MNVALVILIVSFTSISQVLKDVQWPEQFPFKEEYFQRFDE